MTLFQMFPYWDEDHTHAMAIDTFAKSSILRPPARAHLPECPSCLSPRVPACPTLQSGFSPYLSVTCAGTFVFRCGAALKQSVALQIFGILGVVRRYVPHPSHTSSHRWIETNPTGFMQLSSTV